MPLQLKYTEMDYKNLTHSLVFTDIPITQCNEQALNENIMIKNVENLTDLQNEIGNIVNGDNVLHIFFIFQYLRKLKASQLKLTFQTSKRKCFNAKIILCIMPQMQPDLFTCTELMINYYPMKFDIPDRRFETGKDLKSYIERLVLHGFAVGTYSTYAHDALQIIVLLKKRCQSPFIFKRDSNIRENFIIDNGADKLHFVLKNTSYSVYNYSLRAEPFLEFKIEYLLGLYDLSLLFSIVNCLTNFFKAIKVALVNSNLIFIDKMPSDVSVVNPNFSSIFSDIISVFDKFCDVFSSKKFKVQLGNNNCLVFNRRLGISLINLKAMLEYENPQEFISNLVHLSSLYFKCVSKPDICCRMQSLSPEAIVFDFEKFTYYHIDIHRSLYIKICKILYPFVSGVDEDFLQRKYLEIMPVTLIQRFHGKKLYFFFEKLYTLHESKTSMVPLPNGNFRIEKYFDISPKNFCTWCVDPKNTDETKAKIALSTYSDNLLRYRNVWKCETQRFVLENDEIDTNRAQTMARDLLDLEKSEGLCLAVFEDKIVTLEETEILEHDPLEYTANADNCYYNEEDLTKFIQKVKNADAGSLLKTMVFEITNSGLIRFQKNISISPTTFLRIKDTQKLLTAIGMLCDFKNVKTVSLPQARFLNKKYLGNEQMIIQIAKLLNPVLSNLKPEDFEMNNFCCLSRIFTIIRQTKFLYGLLSNLRNQKIKATMSKTNDYTIETDRCEINYFVDSKFSSTNFVTMLENIEKINQEFDGFVYLFHLNFEILDYNHRLYKKNCVLSTEAIQNHFRLFKENDVKHVVIEENEGIRLNRALAIRSEYLPNLDSTAFKLFLKIAEFFYDERRLDHFISLARERINNKWIKNDKFIQFTIADDNKQQYLDLVKALTPCLEHIPDEEIFSYEWLEVLPSHLLMNKTSLKKLLTVVNGIKRYGHLMFCDYFGIHTSLVDLPINIWLQFDSNSIKKFNEFLNYLQNNFPVKLSSHHNPLLTIGGKLCIPREKTPHFPLLLKISDFCKTLFDLNKNRKFSITIDSQDEIMLGNYIRVRYQQIYHMTDKFYTIVELFEDAMNPEDKALMKSICGLRNRKQAITLAKTMNKALKDFSKRMIRSETLRIFPTPLWEACNENDDIYEKAISVFQMLEKKNVEYCVQLNGNIRLSVDAIIVTVTDLLALNDNPDSLQGKVNLLKQLAERIKKYRFGQLTCIEELKYIKEREPRIWSTKASSLAEIIALKKKFNTNELKVRIEPNGTFIINDHLWLKPKNVSQHEASALSEMIKQLFPTSKFQCGNPAEKICMSFLASSDEQLFEYCRNICQYVQDDNGISIKYVVEKNMFEFNGDLMIHPRAFIHLQDIEKVVEVLKEFDKYAKKLTDFENKKNNMSEKVIRDEKDNLKKEEDEIFRKLAGIKKEERIEFEMLKENLYKKLCEIIQKPQVVNLYNFEPKIDENQVRKYYNAVKDFQIQGEYVFQNASSLGFDYKDGQIIEALKVAGELDKRYKCKNYFEFQSLIEIVRALPKFKEERYADVPDSVKMLSEAEQINWWLEQVQSEQDKSNRKHKFFNALKGLHHYFKHPHSFESLEDYYVKMNEFFNIGSYKSEIDYQNGEYTSRHYDNKIYTGYYGIASEDSGKQDYVASFWNNAPKKTKKPKTSAAESLIPLSFLRSNPEATCLIITDTDFSMFKADKETCLNDKILVKTISGHKPNLLKLQKSIEKATYGDVQKVLLFLPVTLKNEITEETGKRTSKEKDRREIDFQPGFSDFTTALQIKFDIKNFILCYPHDMDSKKIEIMRKIRSYEIFQIGKSLIENKNSHEIKNFVESSLSIE